MLHGKKGFERVAWAFRNVLNASLTWLLLVDSSVSAGSLDQGKLAASSCESCLSDPGNG
jgi:ribonuclease P/MRP protein subunit RPP40